MSVVADLTPTPAGPGVHVSKPSPHRPATASYACGCGETRQAQGDDQARDLVAAWTDHRNTCAGRKGRS